MSFIRGGETITIKRRSVASTDDYGNPTYTTTTITVKDALVAIGATTEPIEASRDPIDAKLTIYLPNEVAIADGDVFVIRNTSWVKDGQGEEWVSPFVGLEGGRVIPVRRRVG
jgi:N-acyl-D-aspartate/D-glutamate deacylase